jgi:Lon protease-like protein
VVAQGSVIALFPLHTVLFPGGPLPLRIFETRYTDMVRRCMREQQPFGVVLIQEGEEAGAVASTATVGCSARIADFYRLQDGLLGIACVGERKFRVERVWRASDGLNMGEVAWLEPEPELALPPRYARLGATVRRALEELDAQYQHVEKKFDDAAWVGARLGELLPIEPNDKQALLELDDPLARLDALLALAPGDGSSGAGGTSGAGEGDS